MLNQKYQNILSSIKLLCSNELNYKKLRNRISDSTAPITPQIDIYLSDLAFIETCGQTLFEDGKVNFQKIYQTSEKIVELQVYTSFFIL